MNPLVRVPGFYSTGERNFHTSGLQEKVVQEKFHKKILLSQISASPKQSMDNSNGAYLLLLALTLVSLLRSSYNVVEVQCEKN